MNALLAAGFVVASCVGLAQAGGTVRYSAFCGGLDLAGDGYRVTGEMKEGRFSVRPAEILKGK